jgi:hypothetical protein
MSNLDPLAGRRHSAKSGEARVNPDGGKVEAYKKGRTMNRQIPAVLTALIFVAAASAAVSPPRMRPSPYFGNIIGMSYAGVEDLGHHDYDGSSRENNGLVYTSRAGFIDMGHLRESADRVRYIFEICQGAVRSGQADVSFEVIESASYHVHIGYPANWNTLDAAQKEKIARDVAVGMGQYAAHLSTVWHEIISWYGYASTGLISEKASSFSWEDGYSDLLGTRIAADVLRASQTSYDEAMTQAIRREIEKLDPQPAETARRANDAIKGQWYSGRYPFLSMKKRNFDVGFDDGQITPFRVPGITPKTPETRCPAPALDSLKRHGFTMELTMTPREMERRPVLHIIYPNGGQTVLKPAEHFPVIIDHIRREAIRESGGDVEEPTL